jgi:hypothetical protein
MAIVWRWSMERLVRTIVAILLNKYDAMIVIDGGTGIGKSSLALGLVLRIKREFTRLKKLVPETVEFYYEKLKLEQKGITEEEFIKKLIKFNEKNAYSFTLKKGLIYNQIDLQKFLNKWNSLGICDEGIVALFNRDFYSEEQKNIIKLINISRDHNNALFLCVPNFSSIDTQMRGLCKMRITVVRRGLGVIQCPTRSLYTKDHWNMALNEKIEKEFRNVKKPNYSKLTTFRGIVKFPKLSDSIESKYQIVKDEKRSQIVKEEMGIKNEEDKDIVETTIDKLMANGIRNMNVIEGIALANGLTLSQFRARITRKLEILGKNKSLIYSMENN